MKIDPAIYSTLHMLLTCMPHSLAGLENTCFMDPFNLAQIADDTTTVAAEFIESLQNKLERVFNYSEDKLQSINIKKTYYCNFSSNPVSDAVVRNIVDLSCLKLNIILIYVWWLCKGKHCCK